MPGVGAQAPAQCRLGNHFGDGVGEGAGVTGRGQDAAGGGVGRGNETRDGARRAGDNWQADSFDCLLTGRETTTFVIVPAGNGSTLYVECSNAIAADGLFADNRTLAIKAQNGILWLAAADPGTGTA